MGALLALLLLLLHLLCPRFPRYFATLCECMCMHSRDVTEMCIVVLVMKIAWRVFSTRAEKKNSRLSNFLACPIRFLRNLLHCKHVKRAYQARHIRKLRYKLNRRCYHRLKLKVYDHRLMACVLYNGGHILQINVWKKKKKKRRLSTIKPLMTMCAKWAKMCVPSFVEGPKPHIERP